MFLSSSSKHLLFVRILYFTDNYFYAFNSDNSSCLNIEDNTHVAYYYYLYLGTLYILDLFMRIKNNATKEAVKTIILTFRLASSNHYQLKNGRRHKPKLTMLLQ